MNKKDKKYVQFSKRMVVFVCIGVTIITLAAMILCHPSSDTSNLAEIVKSYVGFATICFAAYSGNSAIEKWLVRKYSSTETNSQGETPEGIG